MTVGDTAKSNRVSLELGESPRGLYEEGGILSLDVAMDEARRCERRAIGEGSDNNERGRATCHLCECVAWACAPRATSSWAKKRCSRSRTAGSSSNCAGCRKSAATERGSVAGSPGSSEHASAGFEEGARLERRRTLAVRSAASEETARSGCAPGASGVACGCAACAASTLTCCRCAMKPLGRWALCWRYQ